MKLYIPPWFDTTGNIPLLIGNFISHLVTPSMTDKLEQSYFSKGFM